MVNNDIIKKIREIEIKSEIVVQDIFAGDYKSVFKGNGIEFDEIREYSEGDEIRDIDWNVTARQNKPFVKKYREERELNVVLMVDISGSSNFGSVKDKSAELCATLAIAAAKNRDRVGAIFFSDKIDKVIPIKNGKKHALSIIENFLTIDSNGKGTDLETALGFFEKTFKKRSVLFIISDFLCSNYEKVLKRVSLKHDVILINIVERAQEEIPKGAIFLFEDMESGELFEVDTSIVPLKVENRLIPNHKNLIKIYSDEDFLKQLKLFFRRRKRLS